MSAVAYFPDGVVVGEVEFHDVDNGCRVSASFSKLPPGQHGFHIHRAGDLRGEGCQAACDHYHKGTPSHHGGPPTKSNKPRHTGDLGNIGGNSFKKTYLLRGVSVIDLYGRSVIVHAEEDDLGLGPFEDSVTTGHSGKRIACAIIGRVSESPCAAKTRKNKHKQPDHK